MQHLANAVSLVAAVVVVQRLVWAVNERAVLAGAAVRLAPVGLVGFTPVVESVLSPVFGVEHVPVNGGPAALEVPVVQSYPVLARCDECPYSAGERAKVFDFTFELMFQPIFRLLTVNFLL